MNISVGEEHQASKLSEPLSTRACVSIFMDAVRVWQNCLSKCLSAHASSGPDVACVRVSAVCVYSEVTSSQMRVHFTRPSFPHPRASMLLTAAPPQTQTSSDWTGSPLPLFIFSPLFLSISSSLSNPIFSSLSVCSSPSFFTNVFQLFFSLFRVPWLCWSHATRGSDHSPQQNCANKHKGDIDLWGGVEVWQDSVSHTMTPLHTFPSSSLSLSLSLPFTHLSWINSTSSLGVQWCLCSV